MKKRRWILLGVLASLFVGLVYFFTTSLPFQTWSWWVKTVENSKRNLPHDDPRLLHQTKGDSNRVYGIAFSPDGKWLFTCGSDGLKQWNASTYRLEQEQQFDLQNLGYPNPVYTLAVAKSEPLVFVGTSSCDVQIWNYETKEIVGAIPTRKRWPHSIPALALSHDGKTLAIAENGGQEKGMQPGWDDFSVLLWDVAESQIRDRLTGHGHSVRCLAFLPGDEYLFADGNSVVWNLEDGSLVSYKDPLKLDKTFRGNSEPRQRVSIFSSTIDYGFKKNLDEGKSNASRFTKWLLREKLIGKDDYVIYGGVIHDGGINGAVISSGKTGGVVASFQQFGNGMRTTTVAVSPDRKMVVTGGDGHARRGGFGNNDDQSDRNLCWWKIAE